jgi:ribosomal protein S27E
MKDLTTNDLRGFLDGMHCPDCRNELGDHVNGYGQADGWKIAGVAGHFCIYVQCSKCNYQWSLDKLVRWTINGWINASDTRETVKGEWYL